jgi:hypothetical protein
MSGIGERLKAHWLAQGLQLPPGVLEVHLQQFEKHFGVTLPYDIRDYFLDVNGMGGLLTYDDRLNWDDDLFRFWPLQELLRMSDEEPYKDLQVADLSSYFIFADHSVVLPAYAIRLDSARTGAHPVIACEGRGHETSIVALSFSEFAERYLEGEESRMDLSYGTPRDM